jgi:hypothetical protein
MEFAAARSILGHPDSAAVSLYDRTADRKSHSHPILFSGEKGIEDAIAGNRIQASAAV